MTEIQRPTVGRIVHYYDRTRTGEIVGPIAAIITLASGDDRPWLTVFPAPHHRRDMHSTEYAVEVWNIPYSDSDPPEPYTWRWPPRGPHSGH